MTAPQAHLVRERATAALARAITRTASRTTYYTIRLMADPLMVDDCYRTYAYFRWADDFVDVLAQDRVERLAFIQRQRALIDQLYDGGRPDDLTPEEELIADAIDHDRRERTGLQSYVRNVLAVLEFDAHRKGRWVSQDELSGYSRCLARAVTDDIQYFVGNGHPYPETDDRYLAATAAHLTHMLRDLVADVADGYVNIPREYLAAHGIGPDDVTDPAFTAWVRGQVNQARQDFRTGKAYLDSLDVLRCRIVGYWYCARFEAVLDTIERDGYVLRAGYGDGLHLDTAVRMAWQAMTLPVRHYARRLPRLVSAMLAR